MWIIIANNYWAFIIWWCRATWCIILITCTVSFLLKINKKTHHGYQLHSLNHCWAHGCGQTVVKGLFYASGNLDDCLYQFSREMKQCKRYKPLLTLCPWASHVFSGKESACQCRGCRFNPWVEKIPKRRKWQPAPVFLPGKSHGQRRLAGYSPWGHKELDMA